MKPVAIFQHDKTQRPGYLLQFLEQRGIDTALYFPAEGDALPADARDFSGLVFLGSNASVHDGLPWIAREERLIQDALHHDRPVLGHCFGGQLLARALGAPVTANATPCIGWDRLRVTPGARHWFGGASEVTAFNWHYETFGIPRGASRTLFGTYCLNKGFSFGRHLGFQCHLEVTEDIVREWCATGRKELEARGCCGVQAEDEILAGLPEKLARLHKAAHTVYVMWMSGLPQSGQAQLHGGW